MGTRPAAGVAADRLDAAELAGNFADIHPPLGKSQAAIEAERCYYCHDAPCVTACPTGIDIPSFIKRIATGDRSSAAERILEENIFGGMCARVCPVETLCEEACVRCTHEGQPVRIGLLQRHATDHALAHGEQYFQRGEPSGRTVGIVGAGPAGLACAHRLAMLGHEAKVYERLPKAGGLNEYGIAPYKVVDDFAQRELAYILAIGGIEVINGQELGDGLDLTTLQGRHDAVFLGCGLGGVRALQVGGEDLDGVRPAVDFIAEVRQAADLAAIAVGRRVLVVGGGMTAVDAAVQARRLGAEEVTMVYRRGPERLSASGKEVGFARTSGVQVRHWLLPRAVRGAGKVEEVELEYMADEGGTLTGTGATLTIAADMVLTAVGQVLAPTASGAGVLDVDGGKLVVGADRATSVKGVWAGGDCIASGTDLTVSAVQDGKVAAAAIDRHLRGA